MLLTVTLAFKVPEDMLIWENPDIIYYFDSPCSADAKTAYQNAASSWNATSIDASLSLVKLKPSVGVMCFATAIGGVDWDGMTYRSKGNGYYNQMQVYLNTTSPNYGDILVTQSVAAHEFGHVFGLDENYNTDTLMNGYTTGINSRWGIKVNGVWNGPKIYKPQQDDINGVNFLY